MASVEFENVAESTDLLLTPSADGRARFSREAYHRLAEVGILSCDVRVELVDGEIFMMSPIGPLHGALVRRLSKFFAKHLPESIDWSAQLPVMAGNHSEPEPDLALLRERDDDYQLEHPAPEDIVLLIEIADTSLARDLGLKLRIYAESGVPEYWVIDVEKKTILVHRDPAGSIYRSLLTVGAGQGIAPLAASECRLEVDWLFR